MISKKKKNTSNGENMKKKSVWYLYFVLIFLFSVVGVRLFLIQFVYHSYYEDLLKQKTEVYVEGESAPRGRILDTNGVVLVDNTLVLEVAYHKIGNPTFLEELEIAMQLLSIFEVEEASEKDLRNFYALKYPLVVKQLITEEEYFFVESRKLTTEDLNRMMRERITSEMLESMSHEEKVLAQFIRLMNEGYAYQNKILFSDASSEIVAKVSEQNIPGIFINESWKRSYPYGDLLRGVFGNLQKGIYEEQKETYLSLGYQLSDTVGISYLEAQYESYLKGEKAKYFVHSDKSLTLVEEAKRGNDLYLSIDIVLQQKLDEVVKNTLTKVKQMPNTEYLKESYAILGDPKTGNIRAMVGRRILEGTTTQFQEVSSNTFLSSFTVGSIVKGASHTVGYLNGVIELNQKIYDSCVKLYFVPEKCSYKKLGYLDDITALKWSSNYYQFLTAIKLAGKQYFYNMQLDAGEEVFQKYRDVFALYGLGSLTGLDVPNEQNGIIGKTRSDDLLLNLTIGQYDTYTPVQLLQYIHTIYNSGKRYSLSLMKEIRSSSGEVLLKHEKTELSRIDMDEVYYDRIREGFRQVLDHGTGSGYVNPNLQAFGKTGTSESFYDSNQDGVVDTKTISSTFAMIGPENDTQYSLVLVTPHLSHYDGVKDYTAPFNRYISTEMSEYLLHYSAN